MNSTHTQSKSSSLFPQLGFGLGLRVEYYKNVLEKKTSAQWFEVVSENFMGCTAGNEGRPLWVLEEIRKHYPLVFHGVSMNLGSVDPLQKEYLKRLKQLIDRFEPAMVSDHLCWTGVGGVNLHDLMPLPYTKETLNHLCSRILKVQETLKRRILIENVSSYLSYKHSEMTEWDFISELLKKADCGLLLDINNVYVSSINHRFDPKKFLDGISPTRVAQFHLAGHSIEFNEKGEKFLIDTHDEPVCKEVWDLYEYACKLFPNTSTMIERDANFPDFSEIESELSIARSIANKDLKPNVNSRSLPSPQQPSIQPLGV